MNYNYQKARDLMVENQLRPNKINETSILNVFKNTSKEFFFFFNLESLSYSDMDITLSLKRGYLKNLHLAQLIKYSNIQRNHKILHIGALTGYFTCLLSNLCLKVFAIESETNHLSTLKKNVSNEMYKNIHIIEGSLKEGSLLHAPYDRIFIDCPIGKVSDKILDQVSNDLGQIIMIEKYQDNLSKAIKITKNNNIFSREYLFDVFSTYELYKDKEDFVF